MSKQLTQKQYALLTARRALAELVFNMSSAEGNPINIVEVMTLLDGITIGGYKISDVQQVLRLDRAWKELFQLVANNRFELSKKTAIWLNELVATDEAAKVGAFRDNQVGIRGVEYIPPHHSTLDRRFDLMLDDVNQRNTAIDRAIACFSQCARIQFFFDGNKRTAQLLMNGILISSGQHIITIPAKEVDEYHHIMVKFYETGENHKLTRFLADRQLDKIMQFREEQQNQRTPNQDFDRHQ